MTNYVQILKQNASPDVIAANPELFDNERLSAAVSNGSSTGHVSMPFVASEHDEQAALFEWKQRMIGQWPELAMLYANVNGQYRPGQRPEPGLMAGVPDVALMVPVEQEPYENWYHGLFIELKRRDRRGEKNGGLSVAQIDWIERLRDYDYRVAICYGWQEAVQAIGRYLGRDEL
jgi:hypothetical protein